jgi:hypothetical protein
MFKAGKVEGTPADDQGGFIIKWLIDSHGEFKAGCKFAPAIVRQWRPHPERETAGAKMTHLLFKKRTSATGKCENGA